ncbi:Uncharacterized protein HZ326_24923 [Fusarium oxysporum f. sp. albedinis]|nr:Uncharacterized protein HZ326_24923 [Fusarium oxysporum f. sp. albedinis]
MSQYTPLCICVFGHRPKHSGFLLEVDKHPRPSAQQPSSCSHSEDSPRGDTMASLPSFYHRPAASYRKSTTRGSGYRGQHPKDSSLGSLGCQSLERTVPEDHGAYTTAYRPDGFSVPGCEACRRGLSSARFHAEQHRNQARHQSRLRKPRGFAQTVGL